MNDYQAYLLRLQRYPERADWQTTLENVHTREVQHFASLDEALRYLKRCAQSFDDPVDNNCPDPLGDTQ